MNDQLNLSGKHHQVYQRELSAGEIMEKSQLAMMWARLSPVQQSYTNVIGKAPTGIYKSNKARLPAKNHPWRKHDDKITIPAFGMPEAKVRQILEAD